MESAFAVSPTMTGTIGWLPCGIVNEPGFRDPFSKVDRVLAPFSHRRGVFLKHPQGLERARRDRGGQRVREQYVRLLWRSVSMSAFGPVTKPPPAEPMVFPREG